VLRVWSWLNVSELSNLAGCLELSGCLGVV